MGKKLIFLYLALCLLLCGCDGWMDDSYVSVKPHMEESPDVSQEIIAVATYAELRDALAALVEDGMESATISVAAFDQAQVESDMNQAVRYILSSHPIGAYAVEAIEYEQGSSGAVPAVALNITYNHNWSQIRRIKRAANMEQAKDIITDALNQCEADVVLRVDGFMITDFVQMIQDYANENPQMVMEIPTVMANTYPESGTSRVVELNFTYQTSREDLRSMQTRVQPVFQSARLYVSGDTTEREKYSHLFSFLAERYDYQIETSITPSYSLLLHGVGDSKAFAVAYAAMCRQSGLECLVVSGTRAGESWFWNIICDEGVYYHVDLIQFSASGGFRERTDGEMEGYVWDYSAYPACGVAQEEAEQN